MEKTVSATAAERNLEVTVKEAGERDALALAELIYDMFKEEQSKIAIEDGQNNAQSTGIN